MCAAASLQAFNPEIADYRFCKDTFPERADGRRQVLSMQAAGYKCHNREK
jgi:hypothetical protein